MNNDTPYMNREIDEKLSDIFKRFDNQDTTLNRIEAQTVKTNGRVSKLERWQSYVLGFCFCLSILVLPIAISLLKDLLTK